MATFYPGDETTAFLLNVLLQSSLLALCGICIAHFFKRHAATRHAILFFAMVAVAATPFTCWTLKDTSAVLFEFSSHRTKSIAGPIQSAHSVSDDVSQAALISGPMDLSSEQGRRPARGAVAVVGNLPSVDSVKVIVDQPRVAAKTSDSINTQLWQAVAGGLALFWIAGVCFWCVRLVIAKSRLKKLAESWQALSNPLPDQVVDVLAQIVPRDKIEVLESEKLTTPICCGFVRPKVVLPEGMSSSLSDVQLRDVLLHEFAHAKRRDPLSMLFQRIVHALFWPNVLVSRLCKEVGRSREDVCDNFVLLRSDAASYSDTLLTIARSMSLEKSPVLAVGLLPAKRSLEDRVSGLLDQRRNVMTRPAQKTCLAVVLLGVVIGAGLGSAQLKAGDKDDSGKAKQKASASRQEKRKAKRAGKKPAKALNKAVAKPTPVDSKSKPKSGDTQKQANNKRSDEKPDGAGADAPSSQEIILWPIDAAVRKAIVCPEWKKKNLTGIDFVLEFELEAEPVGKQLKLWDLSRKQFQCSSCHAKVEDSHSGLLKVWRSRISNLAIGANAGLPGNGLPTNSCVSCHMPQHVPDKHPYNQAFGLYQHGLAKTPYRLWLIDQSSPLGGTLAPIDGTLRSQLKLAGAHGVIVTELQEKGWLSQAGFSVHDIILSVSGQRVASEQQIIDAISGSTKPRIMVSLLRKGQRIRLEIKTKTADRFRTSNENFPPRLPFYIGVQLLPVETAIRAQLQLGEKKCVVVSRVFPNSPAANSGIQRHDIVFSINKSPISNVGEAQKIIGGSGGKPLTIVVLRAGVEKSLTVLPQPGKPKE
jgi:beta-lactamase regulating signal transducer with metallopeptidase domain